MKHTWIEEASGLGPVIEALENADVCALDTEADQFHAYDPRLCLLQLATNGDVWLVDILEIPNERLEPLWEPLQRESLITVMHAGRNDLIGLDRDFGVKVGSLFDTHEAARFLDYDKRGLSDLVEELTGTSLPGSQARFNWQKRPLPDKVKRYAAADVEYLVEVGRTMRDELADAGWLEPHRQLCSWLTDNSTWEPNEFDESGWRKQKGTRNLNGGQANVLHELWQWRHAVCTDINRAAFMVATNRSLVRIAQELPTSVGELQKAKLPGPTIDRRADEILRIVEQAQHDTPPPRPRKKRSKRMSRKEKSMYSDLRKWRNEVANKHGFAPDLLASNRTLREIAVARPRTEEELAEVDEILPWHIERYGQKMLDFLK